jgi:hypothetical protein
MDREKRRSRQLGRGSTNGLNGNDYDATRRRQTEEANHDLHL